MSEPPIRPHERRHLKQMCTDVSCRCGCAKKSGEILMGEQEDTLDGPREESELFGARFLVTTTLFGPDPVSPDALIPGPAQLAIDDFQMVQHPPFFVILDRDDIAIFEADGRGTFHDA